VFSCAVRFRLCSPVLFFFVLTQSEHGGNRNAGCMKASAQMRFPTLGICTVTKRRWPCHNSASTGALEASQWVNNSFCTGAYVNEVPYVLKVCRRPRSGRNVTAAARKFVKLLLRALKFVE
jgi:hypothetical protein